MVVFFFIGAFGFLCVEAQLLLTSSGLRQHAESLVVGTFFATSFVGSRNVVLSAMDIGALDEFGSDIRNALNDHLSATSLSYSEGVNNVCFLSILALISFSTDDLESRWCVLLQWLRVKAGSS